MSSLGELLPRAEKIACLNDQLRKNHEDGRIMLTAGVRAMGVGAPVLLDALAKFDAFDVDNDPHGERDFGHLEVGGEDLLWKIDYYEPSLLFLSADPADPNITVRVLTLMLASEY